MKSFFWKLRYLGLTLLVISCVAIFLIYQALKPKESLPILNPADFSSEIVADSLRHIKKHHRIADFELIDQTNSTFGSPQLKGKIHVADFFFTTCLGMCPILSKEMKRVQDAVINIPDVTLLSFSVTPEIDSVPVLRKYADEKGVVDSKWHLLTGDKQTIYNLARFSYMAAKDEPETSIENDMIHTENFILIDPKGRIRGTYNGTDPKEINQLIDDIQILRNEI